MSRGGVRRMSGRYWTARVTTGHHLGSVTRRPAIWMPARRRDAVNAVAPRPTLRPVMTSATSRRRGVPCTVSCATVARVDVAHRVHRRPARVRRHSCRRGRIQQRSGSHADRRRNRTTRTSGGRRRPRRRAARRQLVRCYSSVPSRTAVKSTNTSMDSSIIRAMRMALLTTMIPRRVSLACLRTTRAISKRRVRLRP